MNRTKCKIGYTTSDSEEISNVFNDHFINVADNITKTIPRDPKSPIDYVKSPNLYSMFLSRVTKFEIGDVFHIWIPRNR